MISKHQLRLIHLRALYFSHDAEIGQKAFSEKAPVPLAWKRGHQIDDPIFLKAWLNRVKDNRHANMFMECYWVKVAKLLEVIASGSYNFINL